MNVWRPWKVKGLEGNWKFPKIFKRMNFKRFFDREDALAVQGLAFCQEVF